MNKNFLSIIIPVLNEENQLNILLESIREQSCLLAMQGLLDILQKASD